MQKNVIIGGLIVWNLILMAALAFIWIGSRGPQTVARQDEPGGESPRSEAEADEQTMQLKAGDRFVGDKALRIADRQVTITTTFEIQDQDGVLVAHGGLAHGYALYVQQTQLLFIVRRNNALTTVDGGYLKPGRHTVTCDPRPNGRHEPCCGRRGAPESAGRRRHHGGSR